MADTRRPKEKKRPDSKGYESDFKPVKALHDHLKKENGKRVALQNQFEKMFLMYWDEAGAIERLGGKNLRVTISPSARNKVLGAMRLLMGTDPLFKVPKDENPTKVGDMADKLEAAAQLLYTRGSRLWGSPLHYDILLSGILFGDVHIGISPTADMLQAAKDGAAPDAAIERLEQIEDETPYYFEVWDPRTGYPLTGRLGLDFFSREYKTLSGELIDAYGNDAKKALKGGDNRYQDVTVKVAWDIENQYLWVGNNMIDAGPHGLPGIPVVATIAEGSKLFSKEEDKRQALLYGMHKSGMWKRENLGLTVLFDQVFGIGDAPMIEFNRKDPKKHLTIHKTGGYKVAETEEGERIIPIPIQSVDQRLLDAYAIAVEKGDESTIYPQAFGEPLASKTATYSLTSLLSQAGRLPLISPQRKLGWAIADMMKFALKCMKKDGKGYSGRVGGNDFDLKASDIPANFELQANLEIRLPQDQLQMMQIAIAATFGDENREALVSVEWAREHLLQIGNSKKMTKQIWDEKSQGAQYANFMRTMLQSQQPPASEANGAAPAGNTMTETRTATPAGTNPAEDPRVQQAVIAAAQSNNQALLQQMSQQLGPEVVEGILAAYAQQQGITGPEGMAR